MNFKRYLSLLLFLCVCLSILFLNSFCVNAAELHTSETIGDDGLTDSQRELLPYTRPYEEYVREMKENMPSFFSYEEGSYCLEGSLLWRYGINSAEVELTPFDSIIGNSTYGVKSYTWDKLGSQGRLLMFLEDLGKDVLIPKGKTATITISDLSAYLVSDTHTPDPVYHYFADYVKDFQVEYCYEDGTFSGYFTPDVSFTNVSDDGVKWTTVFELTPDKNVESITMYYRYRIPDIYPSVTAQESLGFSLNGTNASVSVEFDDGNKGLLKNIIDWLSSIKNSIVDLGSGISEVASSITYLPQRIGSIILDGISSLFVPSEEYITDYSSRWDQLLSDRFGAVYDVCTIIGDFYGNISLSDTTNTITMPAVTIDVGVPFTFGGYDVKIVPDGFENVVAVLKKIISIVCTFMFINGLKKRYEEVMEK